MEGAGFNFSPSWQKKIDHSQITLTSFLSKSAGEEKMQMLMQERKIIVTVPSTLSPLLDKRHP